MNAFPHTRTVDITPDDEEEEADDDDDDDDDEDEEDAGDDGTEAHCVKRHPETVVVLESAFGQSSP